MEDFKKNIEILIYLIVEIGLAWLLVSKLECLKPILPIIGAVSVFFGKLIVTKIKDIMDFDIHDL